MSGGTPWTALEVSVARALCAADGYDPDEDIVGGQAAAFENFGPRWQANERSDNTLGGRTYAIDARVSIAAIIPDLSVLHGAMDILGRAESNASGNPEFDYVGPRVAAVRALLTKIGASQ